MKSISSYEPIFLGHWISLFRAAYRDQTNSPKTTKQFSNFFNYLITCLRIKRIPSKILNGPIYPIPIPFQCYDRFESLTINFQTEGIDTKRIWAVFTPPTKKMTRKVILILIYNFLDYQCLGFFFLEVEQHQILKYREQPWG